MTRIRKLVDDLPDRALEVVAALVMVDERISVEGRRAALYQLGRRFDVDTIPMAPSPIVRAALVATGRAESTPEEITAAHAALTTAGLSEAVGIGRAFVRALRNRFPHFGSIR